MKKYIALIFFFGLVITTSLAQKVEIKATNKALNDILIELKDRYNYQFSYDTDLLASYNISIDKSFSNKESAIMFLLRKFPLSYEISNNVYIIYPEEKILEYRIIGQILDKENLEPLPFSHITINDHPMATDELGNFSFTSSTDSTFRILASHLGYFIHDTLVACDKTHKLLLTAASTDLEEITVTDKIVQTFIKESNQAGNLKLNHKIAGFLPTNNDNSVFELLRLQPGILAAGEQKDFLIIWGSYEGESQVLFDDITLWGLKNYFEDIGAVNPLVVKNIEVLKGGFDARYGDRVGGIVHITGKDGNKVKPSLNLALNNITTSGSYEQPIGKKSSLLFAFRHTYYTLFKDDQIKYATSNVNTDKLNGTIPEYVDLDVTPNYRFRDANLKFSTKWNNGDQLNISLMAGEDRYSYDISSELLSTSRKHDFEGSYQNGGSLKYSKVWKKGNSSSLSISRSELDRNTTEQTVIERIKFNEMNIRRDDRSYNNIREYSTKFQNRFILNEDQIIEAGLQYTNNTVDLKEDSLGINILNLNSKLDKVGGYFQNILNVSNGVTIKAGFQVNYPINLEKLYWEPRISMSVKITDELSFNGAWGLYKQFISKSSVLSKSGKYRYIWVGADEETVPVLESVHNVIGGSYHKNGFTFSVEAYHKRTDGHTRYYRWRNEGNISLGKSKSIGLDFFAKKDFGEHTFWVSYSLSKTSENFDYFREEGVYLRALHDQRHEIKTAGLLALKPFYLSANYIYGSGFPIYSGYNNINSEPDYQRLDASLIYKFSHKKIKSEVGILLHNVMNKQNLTYESFERVPLSQINSISVYTESVPSSIRLYFKITI
ncbi:TonB-dependent receptor plug domain-containing protein [Marinifilum fragile]|uniref:TonB-dependent receptor n=1 Tax=Marinifilum fragile TaxID=570161 RepID=UPI002AA696B2|nr:TonB-dependent receptor plug domain-containing protein [Marinifilum fragile]